MNWRLAKSLVKLRDEVNTLYPNRSKVSDGTIGDVNHSSTVSDHNPNSKGVVCALDLTHDPNNGMDANWLAERLRTSRDARIKYVIFNGGAFEPAKFGWEWQPYTGSNPHKTHMHISVYGDYDNESQWLKEDEVTTQGLLESLFRELLGRGLDKAAYGYIGQPFNKVYESVVNSEERKQYVKRLASEKNTAAGIANTRDMYLREVAKALGIDTPRIEQPQVDLMVSKIQKADVEAVNKLEKIKEIVL